MSKTEILAELAHLSREDLTEVRAWLDHLMLDKDASPISSPVASRPHIRSPRLADPAQAAEFTKQVAEAPADASL